MRRPNSIAFPVAIVLILGMALMMVISTVLTVAVFLLTDGQSRKKIAVESVVELLPLPRYSPLSFLTWRASSSFSGSEN